MAASAIKHTIAERRSSLASMSENELTLFVQSTDELSKLDFSGCDLSGMNLSGKDLRGAMFFRACLNEAHLAGADMEAAEMTGASLKEANLTGANLRFASLGHANLSGAILFNACLDDALLSGANFHHADLRCASMRNARVQEADLREADLTQSTLCEANLEFADVKDAIFRAADLRGGYLNHVQHYGSADWVGVDLRNINFTGAYQLQRFIADQNYLNEFRSSGRLNQVLYWLWWATSDCGRSMLRWCIWILVVILGFAALYTVVSVDYGSHSSWMTPIYYSVVTLTSLGYGDVIPLSATAQLIAMMEVITGYIMLGGLLSILSNKFARRAA